MSFDLSTRGDANGKRTGNACSLHHVRADRTANLVARWAVVVALRAGAYGGGPVRSGSQERSGRQNARGRRARRSAAARSAVGAMATPPEDSACVASRRPRLQRLANSREKGFLREWFAKQCSCTRRHLVGPERLFEVARHEQDAHARLKRGGTTG